MFPRAQYLHQQRQDRLGMARRIDLAWAASNSPADAGRRTRTTANNSRILCSSMLRVTNKQL